jgi:hypothetical protein
LRIALAGLDGTDDGASVGTFAGLTAGADTFAGWVAAMKADLRKETGGGDAVAPAPARPQPAAATTSAAG